MTYVPQVWADGAIGATPITAARLAHIESGVLAAHAGYAAAVPRGGQVVDVLDHGAVGDGLVDDTAAIQAALAAAVATGVRVVLLPRGTYKVTPVVQSRAITAPSNVTLRGQHATIKVASGSPAYEAVISHVPAEALDNFQVEGVIFDLNKAGNPQTAVVANESRCAVKQYRGTGLRFRGNRVVNVDGTNTVVANGGGATGVPVVTDVEITNNVFVDVGGVAAHDHSTIYTHGEGVVITGNRFYGTAGPSPSAVCAIEAHGNGHVVSGNHINGYREAINVTGAANRTDSFTCTGNTIVRCLRGIRVFALALYGGVQPALRGVAVTGNTAVLDPDYWTPVYDLEPYGIAHLAFDSSQQVHGLSITGNTLICKPYTGVSTNVVKLSASGVYYSPAGGTLAGGADVGVTITGNTIHGFPGSGVRATTCRTRGLLVSGNNISDCGHASLVTGDYKAGVGVDGELASCLIAGNNIYDTRAAAAGLMLRGVTWLASTASVDNVIRDNSVRLAGGSGGRNLFVGSNSGSPLVIARFANDGSNVTLPANSVAAGSRVLVALTGVESYQTAAPAGTTWVTVAYP